MIKKRITSEEVKKIAALARIKISAEEEEKFSNELGSILDFFNDISEVDVNGVNKFDHYQSAENQTREDKVEEASKEERGNIKENFPTRKDDQLSVKVVLGK